MPSNKDGNNKDTKSQHSSASTSPSTPPPAPATPTPTPTSPTTLIKRISSKESHASLKTVAEHPGMASTASPPSSVSDLNVELCPQSVKDRGFNILNIELGEGKFSKVYKATMTKDHKVEDIAVKLIRFDNVESQWREGQLKNELKITKKLKHENIIKIIEVIKTRRRAFIFMEKAKYSLDDVLKKAIFKSGLPENYAQGFCEEILRALCYLHGERNVAHRDLKTDNILIDKDNHCKLTYFSFATYMIPNNSNTDTRELSETACGTLGYMAPELHERQKKYDAAAADMWSVGVIQHTAVPDYQAKR